MGMPGILLAVLCGLTLLAAAVTDMHHRRIPNAITLPAIGSGLILTAVIDWKTFWITLATILVIFFAGMFGFMGGGDLKLIMAVVAFHGVMPALCSVGIASVAIIAVSAIQNPKETLSEVKNGLRCAIGKTKIMEQGRRVPFAPYLLFGYIVREILRLLLF